MPHAVSAPHPAHTASLSEIKLYNREEGDALNAIIETPAGCRNKYKYDDKLHLFTLHAVLPAGASFPFDFGFLPSTLGEDGDPMDILVLLDESVETGTLVPARLLGVIEAQQTEKDGTTERNDRLVAVCVNSRDHEGVNSMKDLPKPLVAEIEHFFVSYNKIVGKQFKPLGRHGPKRARKLVDEAHKRFRASRR